MARPQRTHPKGYGNYSGLYKSPQADVRVPEITSNADCPNLFGKKGPGIVGQIELSQGSIGCSRLRVWGLSAGLGRTYKYSGASLYHNLQGLF